ncbi:protein tyrosine phosphatase [Ereboglobus luteus]|nr:protein tyrosine phosphatase [Ereboglobus luteus]
MNRRRSSTAERIYRNDPRVEVRSAGVRTGANRRVSEDDLRWADVVFVMEREHKHAIATRFAGLSDFSFPPVDVLDVPDEFEFMEPDLVEILKTMLDPEIDHLLANNG